MAEMISHLNLLLRERDSLRASVKELLDLLTEPAGFNPRLLEGDSARFGEFLDANEARVKAATARALALLAGLPVPRVGEHNGSDYDMAHRAGVTASEKGQTE